MLQEFGEELQLVAFTLAGEEYGVDIHIVQEIIRLLSITRVPKAPEHVVGVINLRGNVVPVIDLNKRFNLAPRQDTDKTRIIIVKVKDITAGIIVDEVSEVLRLSVGDIEPTPSLSGAVKQEYLYGVGKLGERLLILLNLTMVMEIASPEEE